MVMRSIHCPFFRLMAHRVIRSSIVHRRRRAQGNDWRTSLQHIKRMHRDEEAKQSKSMTKLLKMESVAKGLPGDQHNEGDRARWRSGTRAVSTPVPGYPWGNSQALHQSRDSRRFPIQHFRSILLITTISSLQLHCG